MSDGGDGFGEVMAGLLGARAMKVRTVDAAHRALNATWWWEPRSRTAIIESARVIGLAMLLRGKFHPFELDTFGLGAALQAAAKRGARRCLIGIGGSATNDGGFGLARALGWRFLDPDGKEIVSWTKLSRLRTIERPIENGSSRRKEAHFDFGFQISDFGLVVAVDVQNRLLGPRGCTRVYGPQKGLRLVDFPKAEAALRQLATVTRRMTGKDLAGVPGAGAAGGLGFGLMAFASARAESGFALFAKHAQLAVQIRRTDLVITGEGSLDRSTLMGKGVGEIAALCRTLGKPCIGIGGRVGERSSLRRRFAEVFALVDFASPEEAMRQPAKWLETTAVAVANSDLLRPDLRE
jgi:glycerate kinase